MKQVISIVLVGVIFICGANPLRAEEHSAVHPYLDQKFYLDAGVFFPTREVTLTVDGSIAGSGDDIDFDEQLGLKKHVETFSLNFGWRFGEKWQLEGQYFESSGRRDWVLEEDVEWRDVIFEQGSSIGGGQNFSVLRVFFARRFESGDNYEFGVGAGLHWLEIGAFIEGNAIISGGGNEFRRESVSAAAPLPNFGAWYNYSFSPKWALTSRIDYLSANIGEYSGSLANASVGVNYQMFKHVGFGLNYNYFHLDLSVDLSDWRGGIETKYRGPFLYMSFYW